MSINRLAQLFHITYNNCCSFALSVLLDTNKFLSQILSNVSAVVNEQFNGTVQREKYKLIDLNEFNV